MNHNLLPAKNWQLVEVSGNQAQAFLQGQLTADMTQLSQEQAGLAAACDLKGRVLASLYVLKSSADGGFYIFLPTEVWKNLAEFWQKYLVLYRQMSIRPMEGICYLGKNVAEAVLSLPFDSRNSLMLFSADLSATTTRNWDSYLIDQAIPHIYVATIGEWIPQMLGYDQLGALSYTKGCYIGQEVIARVHYRGKPNRACQPIAFSMNQTPRINMPLHNIKRKPIGNLVNFYCTKRDSYKALAVLSTNLVDCQNVLIQDNESFRKVRILAPP